ncbi:MAG TPA: PIN domain-containing protein [Burkholderiales bacterium]|jgi:predicted nucleic acid-binding protein
MTGPVFVDANVFLYALDRDEVRKRPLARAWLEYLWREALGRTSIQVLSEYYVNLTRKGASKRAAEGAWEDVRMYLSWNPREIDEEVFLRARENEQRYRISWWDSLVVAAAQLQDCALLLTEDLQDGAVLGSVTVRSPFTLEIGEAGAQYAIPEAPSRHRGRGRPRRPATAPPVR